MDLSDYAKSAFNDRLREAERLATAPIYAERAAAIKAAREEGRTWRSIADELGMTQLAVQNAAKMD